MQAKFLPLMMVLSGLFLFQQVDAQYCTPSISTGGVYISYLNFGYSSTVTGGQTYSSSTEGYADRSGSSAGTIKRNCSFSVYYNVQNCGNRGAKDFNIRLYIDWNHDNDFDDAGELAAEQNKNVPSGNCALLGTSISARAPFNAVSGNTRVRVTLREGTGSADACGTYTGEVEDYTLVIADNTAPVIDNSGEPFINALAETQTDNNGFTIAQLVTSTQPDVTLITDADNCSETNSIALTSVTASNGEWQYKVGAGSWSAVGAVSESNALLLYSNSSTETRIRFVPTGQGTSSFGFRAWDRTAGENGTYYNIAATGGTTAFSTASETASLLTYSTAAVAGDVNAYMVIISSPDNYDVTSSSLNLSTGVMKESEQVTTGLYDGYGNDIALDKTNNKLIWCGGPSTVDILRSNLDGTGVETITGGGFSWPTGVAVSEDKLFIADYYTAIYSANLDGTGMVAITGGAGQATDIGTTADIEYYDSKIYYVNQPGGSGDYKLFSAATDGTGTTELYATANYIYGLYVTNNTLYWTEYDGSAGYVKTKPISGGSATTLASQSGIGYYNLMVDQANSRIYIAAAGVSGNEGMISTIPLTGGTPVKALMMGNTPGAITFNASAAALPVRFITVKAYEKNKEILVDWTVGTEDNVERYIVERSADGQQFYEVGTVAASRQSGYSWPDKQPLRGDNFYRIKAVDKDGSALYSSIVKVTLQAANSGVSVYPTIVTGDKVNLQLIQLPAGKYTVNLFDMAGRMVRTIAVQHAGGSSTRQLSLGNALSKGWYKVQISGAGQHFTATISIK